MRNSGLTLAARRRQALLMLERSGTRELGRRNSMHAFQRIFSWSIVALFVSVFPSRAHAYSWMIKHGYAGCPVCHADPSGGELLTAYGRAQSDLLLRMRYGAPGGGSVASDSSKSTSSSFDSFDSDDDSGSSDKPAAKGTDKPAAKPAHAKPADGDDDDKSDANSGDDDDDDDKPAADAPADGEKKPAAAAKAAAPAKEEESSTNDSGASTSSGFLWGLFDTPDWLLLGGSYRQLAVEKPSASYFRTFPMMADVYGQVQLGAFRVEGSIGIVRVGAGSPYGRASQITRGQGEQWNLLSRTHWLGYDFDDGRYTLRAGHLNLPFGVRIPEHTMWVRQLTRTDRESDQQDGVSLAFNGESLRGEVMGILGNYQVNPDRYRERGYSLYLEYLTGSRTAIGVSSLVTVAKEDRISLDPGVPTTRQAHGPFVRTAFSDKTVLLTEADVMIQTSHEVGYVGFAQLDFEATQGLHFMATGEVNDQGYDNKLGVRRQGAGEPDFGGWFTIDWFCLPHVEVRADLFSRQDDVITALGQLHVFL